MKYKVLKISTLRLACAAVITGLAIFLGASSRVEWVLTPQHVYYILPPALVTENTIKRVDWSPNGAFLLVDTTPKPPTDIASIFGGPPNPAAEVEGPASLLVWDRTHSQVRKVWTTDDPSIKVTDVVWLHGSNTVFVTMGAVTPQNGRHTAAYGVMALNAETGKFAWVAGLEHLTSAPEFFTSPTKPIVVVGLFDPVTPESELQSYTQAPEPGASWIENMTRVLPAEELVTLGPDGAVTRRVKADCKDVYVDSLVWDTEGASWYLSTRDRRHKGETPAAYKERVNQTLAIQSVGESGELTQVKVNLYAPPKEMAPDLVLHSKALLARQRKVSKGYSNLWLSSHEVTFHPDALISADGKKPQFAPTRDAVFYIEGGIAKVTPLVKLSDDQKKALFQALRAEALSNSKQVALGLLMYSNDYDDMLPSADNLDGIGPYTKNQNLLDGFMYTPPGNLNSSQIESPATTVLGYIEGPGGRAVAYSDGHCKWVPDP